jgi:tetratricopeptide (TPR) repeat protein
MGVVYRATQVGLNRTVALKMVRRGSAPDHKDLIRFLAEADAVAAVRHPNVVQVYGFGDANGEPFLALEHLGGGTLADQLRSGARFAPRAAAELVGAVARGVAAAHAQQIVHRDIKPGNILFDDAGAPKVTDFGLARRGPGTELTVVGAVMGTPAYMAPEQARGEARFVGPAADVWALGVVLYECLAAARPFETPDVDRLLISVRTESPRPLAARAPDVPRDLELVVAKCLAKDPADRYPTAAELAVDLERFLGGDPVSVRAVGSVERARKWAARNRLVAALSAGLVAVVLVALVALFGLWRRAEAETARAEEARAAEERRATEAEDARRRAEAAEAVATTRGAELAAANRAAHRNLQELAAFAADFTALIYNRFQGVANDAAGRELLLKALAAGRRAAESPDTPSGTRVRLSAGFVTTAFRFEFDDKVAEAADLYGEAVELARGAAASAHPHPDARHQLASALTHRASALAALGRGADAVPLSREAIGITTAKLDAAAPDDKLKWRWNLCVQQATYGDALRAANRSADAVTALRAAEGYAQNPSHLRHIAGSYALLASATAAPKERDAHLAEGVRLFRAALDAGWRAGGPGSSFRKHTRTGSDFAPFADRPEVNALLKRATGE